MLRGIDITSHERKAQLKGDFVWIKATQNDWEDVTFNGTGTYDGERIYLLREAINAGKIVGAYHFLIQGDRQSIIQQASKFVRAIRLATPTGYVDNILCAVVVEHSTRDKSSPTLENVRDFIKTFQHLVPNHPLFVHTNKWYWANSVKLDLREFDHVYLWLGHWTDASGQIDKIRYTLVPPDWWNLRIGGLTPTIIQFTSQARAGEVRVNGNLFRGHWKDLDRFTRVVLQKPQPPVNARKLGVNTVKVRAIPSGRATKLVVGSMIFGVIAILAVGVFATYRAGKSKETIFEQFSDD